MEIIAKPQPPTGLRRALFRLPIQLYRLRLGWLLGQRCLLLTHIGRVSGARRNVVIEVLEHDPGTDTYLCPSGYGAQSDWFRNVRKTPEVTVMVGTREIPVTAEVLTSERGAEAMATYALRHPRAARKLCRFMGFAVDGSAADYRLVGRELKFVRFTRRT